MRIYKKKPWSKAEKGILASFYYIIEKEELYKLLPDRTPNSIRKQVYYLKGKIRFQHESKSKEQ
jgi:hypothetical protein|tara:strand:+ start:3294 stop:3485 length:192 start_codon:yes stop_codon:yes gene_type:complete